MYSVYPKDGLLLHLGQEQGIGKVISFEYIFITNTLTVWSISKKLDSLFFFWLSLYMPYERVLPLIRTAVGFSLSSGRRFIHVFIQDVLSLVFCCNYQQCCCVLLMLAFGASLPCNAVLQGCFVVDVVFFPTKKDVNDSLQAKALILAKFALR